MLATVSIDWSQDRKIQKTEKQILKNVTNLYTFKRYRKHFNFFSFLLKVARRILKKSESLHKIKKLTK